jgi:RimJ/RimL family protein N-acetyltransferase
MDWRAAVPAGRTLVRVDEGWLARHDLANVEQIAGWVDSFWHSHADFVQHSFGYCLLEGDAVASWCLGVFVSGQEVELGLATVPGSRGQGYATAVAARCVAHCAEQGLTPHWHCWDDNVASWRVAEKVGFVDPTPYTVYFCDIRHDPVE